MTENGTPNAGATYADLRQKRADRPAGGNFLGAKNLKGKSVELTVLGTEVRKGYKPANLPANSPEPDPDLYWQVKVTRGLYSDGSEIPEGALVKENQFMSDWLEENQIEDPTGKSFALIVETYKNNLRFAIDRVL